MRSAAFTALLAVLVTVLTACAPAVQRTTLPATWQPSPNFNDRRANFIVLHHTSNASVERALQTLTDPQREVSAHYLIGRDGKVVQLVDERARAWHAGESYWGGQRDLNSASIGIELDNNGDEPYPKIQIDALLRLLADLRQRLQIPATNVVGHGDIAPGRKVDPGRNFPWRTLADAGFGLWCEPPQFTNSRPDTAAVTDIDPATALAALGYDTADLAAAIGAFKRHFAPDSPTTPEFGALDHARLACLIALKRAAGA